MAFTSFAEPLFRRQSFYERFIFDSFSPHPSSAQKRFSLPHNPLHNHQANHTFSSGHKRYNTKPKSCNKKYNTTNSLFFSTIAQQIFAVTFF